MNNTESTTEYDWKERLQCFGFLWASAMFFQMFALASVVVGIATGTWRGVAEFALVLAAGALIWRPGIVPLLMLAAIQVCDSIIMMPGIPNHRFLTFFINLTLLASAGSTFLQGKKGADWARSTWTAFCQTARIELIIFYCFAVFVKLNAGFLTAGTSCASAFYLRMARTLPFMPLDAWAAENVIYLTVITEAAIPALLCFRRTRMWGILLGLLFHFMLSVDYAQHTMDFTSLLYALYFLFTPVGYLEKAAAILGLRRADLETKESASLRWARLLMLGSFTIVLCSGLITLEPEWGVFFITKHVLWYPFALGVIVAHLLIAFRCDISREPRPFFGVQNALCGFCVLLLFVNGLGPYVGFKTRSSYDMYSNLRMEPPAPNHAVIPRSLDLFGFQSDSVHILSSNDPYLQRLSRTQYDMLYFEFASYVASHPNLQVTYVRNGEQFSIADEASRKLVRPPPTILRKFLQFRNVDRQPIVRCDW